MTNIGPLTTTFTPAPSCTRLAGFSFRDHHFEQGPVETEGCFPDGYQQFAQFYYSPGVCPSGYSVACSNLNSVGTVTETIRTCCPIAHSAAFVCQGPVDSRYPWQSTLGCVQPVLPGTRVLDTVTSITGDNTFIVTSTTLDNGAIGAYAVVVRSQYGDIAHPTTTASSTNLPSATDGAAKEASGGNSHGSKVSTGAAAGIGIGCGLAVLLLGIGALLFWKKRERSRRAKELDGLAYRQSRVNELPAMAQYHHPTNKGAHPELPTDTGR